MSPLPCLLCLCPFCRPEAPACSAKTTPSRWASRFTATTAGWPSHGPNETRPLRLLRAEAPALAARPALGRAGQGSARLVYLGPTPQRHGPAISGNLRQHRPRPWQVSPAKPGISRQEDRAVLAGQPAQARQRSAAGGKAGPASAPAAGWPVIPGPAPAGKAGTGPARHRADSCRPARRVSPRVCHQAHGPKRPATRGKTRCRGPTAGRARTPGQADFPPPDTLYLFEKSRAPPAANRKGQQVYAPESDFLKGAAFEKSLGMPVPGRRRPVVRSRLRREPHRGGPTPCLP
jgi:hypothetical protein